MFEFHYIKNEKSFHARRLQGIGASDIPVLAGYTKKYTVEINGKKYPFTPYVLGLIKTGRISQPPDNDPMWFGRKIEPIVIERFMMRHGLQEKDVIRKTEFRHPEYSYAMSHPDLIVYPGFFGDDFYNQEIKTGQVWANRKDDPDYGYSKDDFTANGIPASVYCQVQWQEFTTGINISGVSPLINTSDYREYGPIIFNKKNIEKLLARADEFWWYVRNWDKAHPTPETWGDVQLIYPQINQLSATVAGETEAKVMEMKARGTALRAKAKKIENELADLQGAVGIYLGENKILTGADGGKLASQSVFNRRDLSLKDLEKENPWLYKRVKKYIKTSEVRRIYW